MSMGLPMTERPQRKDAGARRLAILTAAETLFAEKGLNVPLVEICDAAGVGRATLYRNFDNRIELVKAIMSNNQDKLESIAAGTAAPDQIVVDYLSEVLAQLVKTSGLVYLIQNDPIYSERFMGHLDLMLSRLEGTSFRPGLDANLMVIVVNMMSGGLVQMSYADRQKAAPLILEIALRALR